MFPSDTNVPFWSFHLPTFHSKKSLGDGNGEVTYTDLTSLKPAVKYLHLGNRCLIRTSLLCCPMTWTDWWRHLCLRSPIERCWGEGVGLWGTAVICERLCNYCVCIYICISLSVYLLSIYLSIDLEHLISIYYHCCILPWMGLTLVEILVFEQP